jgi:transcriptional regulator with XRE-family HTH domain
VLLRCDHVQRCSIGDQATAGDHFELALPVDRNLAGGKPFANARAFDAACPRYRSDGAEMLPSLIWRHARDCVGNPILLSIGNPPHVGAMLSGMTTSIGRRLRETREELQKREGLKKPNRAKFAREIKIAPASLTQLESGSSARPASETLLKLRDRGINPDYIMRGKGSKFTEKIERNINKLTILEMMDRMDDDEQQTVIDVAEKMIRHKRDGEKEE